MIGKTIRHVQDLGYDGVRLHFTDGSSADFQGEGYECDGVSLHERTAVDQRKLAAEAQGRRETERVRKLAAETRRRAAAARRERIKRNVSPAAYQEWMKRHEPGYLIKSLYLEPMRKALIEQTRFDFNRQFFGGCTVETNEDMPIGKVAVIPILNKPPAKPIFE